MIDDSPSFPKPRSGVINRTMAGTHFASADELFLSAFLEGGDVNQKLGEIIVAQPTPAEPDVRLGGDCRAGRSSYVGFPRRDSFKVLDTHRFFLMCGKSRANMKYLFAPSIELLTCPDNIHLVRSFYDDDVLWRAQEDNSPDLSRPSKYGGRLQHSINY
jgi:hypothetical protein